MLQGEAELLEQQQRDQTVTYGAYIRLTQSIARETGLPIEDVDQIIAQFQTSSDINDTQAINEKLKALGALSSDAQEFSAFLNSQALLSDHKRTLVTALLLGRAEYMAAEDESEEWIHLKRGEWDMEDTRKLPKPMVDELHDFLMGERAAQVEAGKPPEMKAQKRPRTTKLSPATNSSPALTPS
ncbi:hypothetical protein [Candidatus Regnicoccus frigidus]|uniref:hypothetical protein n=1 Tax=Candidatus Regnicoccus frigidus TaxID=3074015 RepID=UPI0028BEAE78|nr:hypothetical protein [Candidatus Regnicoccus frigidus]